MDKCKYCGEEIRTGSGLFKKSWFSVNPGNITLLCKMNNKFIIHQPIPDNELVDKLLTDYYEI